MHPEWGFELVKDSRIVAEESHYPVIQHHERMDGSGYPLGLPGKRIHRFGRIIAVCDVFDALTTRRVYQEAMATYPAFRTMYDNRQEFDAEILREFTILMGPNDRITEV
jgi:HD-GYP domain-containing protein (c-di-GMP phosphodiesterase class II)